MIRDSFIKKNRELKSPFVINPYRFIVVVTEATYGYQQNGSSTNVIDRYSFATDGNAVDVGDTNTIDQERGASSDITGGYSYVFAGDGQNAIERHQNAVSASGADVGNLTNAIRLPSSSESSTHGYRGGGWG
jgi:hypothetical protein